MAYHVLIHTDNILTKHRKTKYYLLVSIFACLNRFSKIFMIKTVFKISAMIDSV